MSHGALSPWSGGSQGVRNVSSEDAASSWGVSSMGSGFALPFVWMLRNNTFPKEKREDMPLLLLQEGGFLLDP